jgi:hypothetical protein
LVERAVGGPQEKHARDEWVEAFRLLINMVTPADHAAGQEAAAMSSSSELTRPPSATLSFNRHTAFAHARDPESAST